MKKIINNRLFLILILLLSVFLRLYRLGNKSFWRDEAELFLSSVNLKEIAGFLFKDFYPLIGYKIIAYLWKSFGNTEFILRLSSVLFGICCIYLVYLIGKFVYSERFGLMAAFLTSISAFHIYYSQEFRMYTFMSLLALLSLFVLFLFLDTNGIKNIYLIIYVIINVINIYVHPSVILLSIVILTFLIFNKKYRLLRNKLLTAHIIMTLFLIPWIYSSLNRLLLILKKDIVYLDLCQAWIPNLSLSSIFQIFKDFGAGFNCPEYATIISALVLIFLFIVSVITNRKKRWQVLLSYSCFTPMLIAVIISIFMPILISRYFIYTALILYAILSSGLLNLPKRISIPCITIFVFFNLISLKNYYSGIETNETLREIGINVKLDEYREAANFVIKNFSRGDLILHIHPNTSLPFRYYFSLAQKNNLFFDSSSYDLNRLIIAISKKGKLIPYEYFFQNNRLVKVQGDFLIGENKKIWLILIPFKNSLTTLDYFLSNNYIIDKKKNFKGVDVFYLIEVPNRVI